MLDPVDPTLFVAVASTSRWASCNSAIRAGEFVTWLTLTEDPLRTQDDRLSRILNEEVPRDSLLGDEL